MKQFHLHLVSDSTGETVSSVARAALAQFDALDPEEHIWSLVRTRSQLEKVIAGIEEKPGAVLYTIADDGLSRQLEEACRNMKIPVMPIIREVVSMFTSWLGEKVHAEPGKQHRLDQEYFSRVDAINYALAHDDGQSHWDIEDADVVLIGVSRTSKSPTCMYLAFRGYKAANVPFVPGVPMPETIEQLKKPLLVGLTVGVERLSDIRKVRLASMKAEDNTTYVDQESISAEITEARKYFSRLRCPVVDVTRRSVEETAAYIITLLSERGEVTA